MNMFLEVVDIMSKTYFTVLICVTVLTCITLYSWKRKLKSTNEIIVFTRYPVAGKAKTRLIPHLGAGGAASLQVNMTEHAIKMLQRVFRKDKDLSVTLQYNGGLLDQMKYWFDRKLHGLPCVYRPQCGDNLGEKLKLAVQNSFDRGNKNVVVIGADIPGVNESVIHEAFCSLTDKQTNMVIGKAQDGGYYLIGFTCEAQVYLDSIFEEIDWGTDKVFLQQINRAKSLGACVSVLNTVLQDVDTEEDIEVFEREVGVTRQQLQKPKWSIVIPVLNEEAAIISTLNNVLQSCSSVNNLSDIIISDGGSTDKSIQHIQEFSKTSPVSVTIIHSKPGRGHQLISGAEAAIGDNFLFLHADSKLPMNYDQAALDCLQIPGNVAGAFKFKLDGLADHTLRSSQPWWFILQMRALEWGAKKRCEHLERPYGDQAIFMSKNTYKEVGGFPPVYLMEDFIMVEKLKTVGHIGIAKGHPVITSYRRWKKYGYVLVTGTSTFIVFAYKMGVHPDTLAKWYYGKKLKTS